MLASFFLFIPFMLKRYLLYIIIVYACPLRAQQLYEEEYRPQFHFSPANGWIGDPDGLIKYQDKYHLFWWGHANSSDLVHWEEQVYPMRGDDGTFSYYTGSVVVDENNTSGFGDGITPPMIAIYTAHNKSTGVQDQRISYSTDGGERFQYYTGNPVLTINSKDFRDPDVFWHEETKRWIMAITMPLDRRVDFYSSPDMKSWTFLSSFGPYGAREQVWEVPQLIQLPVDGNPNNRKWVLLCSMGPNKVQYFVGNFDGTNFVLDDEEALYLEEGEGLEGTIFERFEGHFDEWSAEGTAFGNSPVSGALPDQTTVSGFLGTSFVNSYHGGDAAVGRLTSKKFFIEHSHINFLISGGSSSGTSLNLVVNGVTVRTSSGFNSEAFKWRGWDVREFIGQEAQLVVLDNVSGSWGHVSVDHIMFSDRLINTEREHARWVDWGADFYAARAYRDYDDPTILPVVWLGWMGNWEYANQVPTSWGRGAQSIPRSIELRTETVGYHLVQQPISALQQLREQLIEIGPTEIEGFSKLNELQLQRNTYEVEVTFEVTKSHQHFGLNFFAGPSGRVTLGFDAATSTVYLDRRYSGNSTFSSQFPKKSEAPIVHSGSITFHVFVDQSSIEVFVNDGALVFTSLVFPYSSSHGIEVFSENGSTTMENLTLWKLKSIWGIEPPNPVTNVEAEKKSNIRVYPNPAKSGEPVSLVWEEGEVTERGYVVVRDGRGAIVFHRDFNDVDQRVIINPNLPPGLYLLEFHDRNKALVKKIIVK